MPFLTKSVFIKAVFLTVLGTLVIKPEALMAITIWLALLFGICKLIEKAKRRK